MVRSSAPAGAKLEGWLRAVILWQGGGLPWAGVKGGGEALQAAFFWESLGLE